METTSSKSTIPFRPRPRVGGLRVAEAPASAASPPPYDDDKLVIDTRPRQTALDLDDGVYRLTLTAIEEGENPFDAGKQRLVWKFAVDGHDGTLHFYSSVSRGPRLAEALNALRVPFAKSGETALSKSAVVGRTCQGRVENVTTQRGGVFPRIKQLFP